MNFSKLPKEKRTHLVLVAVLTVLALGGLGFGLIKWQFGKLSSVAEKTEVAHKRLKQVQTAIGRADQIENEFKEKSRLIVEQEEAMATGDVYSWVVNLLRRFKLSYKVEIPQIGQPTAPGDVNLIPNYPYKQVSLRVGGIAFYQDFGKFIADFENEFPHIRIVNLTLEPASNTGSGEKEKLNFAMDLVALVKPNAP